MANCKCGGGGPVTVLHDERGCYDMGAEAGDD